VFVEYNPPRITSQTPWRLRLMSDTVVQFDVNRRCNAIERQEKRASEALLAASKEFKRLAELKANAKTL
jgi:hypothetical protein